MLPACTAAYASGTMPRTAPRQASATWVVGVEKPGLGSADAETERPVRAPVEALPSLQYRL